MAPDLDSKCPDTVRPSRRRNPPKGPQVPETDSWPCRMNGCRKRFAREADLRRHQRTSRTHSATGRSNFCPQCGAAFTRTDALRRHQKSRHKPSLAGSSDDRPVQPLDQNVQGVVFNIDIEPEERTPVDTPSGPSTYYRQHTVTMTPQSRFRNRRTNHKPTQDRCISPAYSPYYRPHTHTLPPSTHTSASVSQQAPDLIPPHLITTTLPTFVHQTTDTPVQATAVTHSLTVESYHQQDPPPFDPSNSSPTSDGAPSMDLNFDSDRDSLLTDEDVVAAAVEAVIKMRAAAAASINPTPKDMDLYGAQAHLTVPVSTPRSSPFPSLDPRGYQRDEPVHRDSSVESLITHSVGEDRLNVEEHPDEGAPSSESSTTPSASCQLNARIATSSSSSAANGVDATLEAAFGQLGDVGEMQIHPVVHSPFVTCSDELLTQEYLPPTLLPLSIVQDF